MDNEHLIYETPQVEIVEVEVEKGFSGSNVENPIVGDESEW